MNSLTEAVVGMEETQTTTLTNLEIAAGKLNAIRDLSTAIVANGVSMEQAEYIEACYPGVLSARAKIKGYTQNPSSVNLGVTMEALDWIKGKGTAAIIAVVVAGVVALLAWLVKKLAQYLDKKDAEAAIERSKANVQIVKATVDIVSMGDNWWETPEVISATESYLDKYTQIVTDIAGRKYTGVLRDLLSTRPKSVVDFLAEHVLFNLGVLEDDLKRISGNPQRYDKVIGNSDLVAEAAAMTQKISEDVSLCERAGYPSVSAGRRGLLSQVLGSLKADIEADSNKPGGTFKDNDFLSVIATRDRLNHAVLEVTKYNMKDLSASMTKYSERLANLKTDIDRVLGNSSTKVGDEYATAVSDIQHLVTMLQNSVTIAINLYTAPLNADAEYLKLLAGLVSALKDSDIDPEGTSDSSKRAKRFLEEYRRYTA